MAITLLNYNFKGGVGKTTLTGMQAYLLSRQGKRVLCVDIDPQSNLTEMISETYDNHQDPMTDLYNGFNKGSLENSVVHISKNLDLIPSDWDLNKLVNKLAFIRQDKRWNLLRNMLKPFQDKYDYILLDVPPTLNDIVINAIFAADGISIVLQTQKMAYTSALKTIKELVKFRNVYHTEFHFLGVVIYLVNKAKVDRDVVHAAKSTLKGALFDTPIKFQERVKGFTANGIKDRDHWDERAIGNYYRVNNEIIKTAKEMMK